MVGLHYVQPKIQTFHVYVCVTLRFNFCRGGTLENAESPDLRLHYVHRRAFKKLCVYNIYTCIYITSRIV